jgi:hypothetical protein
MNEVKGIAGDLLPGKPLWMPYAPQRVKGSDDDDDDDDAPQNTWSSVRKLP